MVGSNSRSAAVLACCACYRSGSKTAPRTHRALPGHHEPAVSWLKGFRGEEPMLDIRRRQFITLLGGPDAAWQIAARTQQRERMRRVGALMAYTANDPQAQIRDAAFLQGLRQLG